MRGHRKYYNTDLTEAIGEMVHSEKAPQLWKIIKIIYILVGIIILFTFLFS